MVVGVIGVAAAPPHAEEEPNQGIAIAQHRPVAAQVAQETLHRNAIHRLAHLQEAGKINSENMHIDFYYQLCGMILKN